MAKEEYIWAIGDIHGHSLSLKAILEKIEQYNNKTLIFLGDYIDRGPNPKEVLDIIMSLNNKIALMGEHEYLLLSSLEGEQQKPEIILEWSKYGYETTLKDFEASDVESLNKNLDAKYKDFLQSLAIFHTEKFSSSKKDFDLLFSHAGPFPDIPLSEQLNIKNFKDYNSFLESKRLGILMVVCLIMIKFFKRAFQHGIIIFLFMVIFAHNIVRIVID